MNYNLNKIKGGKADLRFFWSFLRDEKIWIGIAFLALVTSSALNLWAPVLVGHAIDRYIIPKNMGALWGVALQLAFIYVGAFVAAYVQTRAMGGVGQRLLFKLRNTIFKKIEELPVAFFAQNKAGDLISRINNDTDKLNTFFSQSIMQFVGNGFMMIGAAIFLLSINVELGGAVLAPAVLIFLVTRLMSPIIKAANARSLKTTGGLSAAVQESLENFKVVIAFNRRDYFRENLEAVNKENYSAAFKTGIANNIFTPFYTFTASTAQIIAVIFGIYLIAQGALTIGLLVSFLTYVTRFYDPVRQIASFWASLQSALAAGDRVKSLLDLSSDMGKREGDESVASEPIIEFKGVGFAYPEGKRVLQGIDLTLYPGKVYALVGPTGGGKTTTASLIARLYDPTEGEVHMHGKDIRCYADGERTEKIGFILQDPFLFRGTVAENIVYANERLKGMEDNALEDLLKQKGLDQLFTRFDQGLKTMVEAGGRSLSAGQQQILAFARAVLRDPELLILDEATANIDTVTEQLLQQALHALPPQTTRIVIAHRLNTIENADEIFFVNGGSIVPAGSLKEALDMLLHKDL